MKRSHMTGGLLIQSPQNDLEDRKCMNMISQHFQNGMKSLAVPYALLNIKHVHVHAKVTIRYFLKYKICSCIVLNTTIVTEKH